MSRTRTASRSFVCAIVSFIIAAEKPCAAQSPVEVAIQQGVQLRREHRDEEALAEFQRVYRLDPSPRVRAQIALAEQALGRWRAAEEDLADALGSHDDAWIAASRGVLESSRVVIASHLATIRAASNIADARLRVNDDAPVTLPCMVRVALGSVSLRVEAPGFAPLDRTFSVTAAMTIDENFSFRAAVPVASPVASSMPQLSPLAPAWVTPSRAVRAFEGKTLGWAIFAASVAPLAFGVIETVMREEHVSVYNDDSRCPPGLKDVNCGGERTAAENDLAFSVAGYASAITLATVGAVLLLAPTRDAVRVRAWATPGSWGGGVAGHF